VTFEKTRLDYDSLDVRERRERDVRGDIRLRDPNKTDTVDVGVPCGHSFTGHEER
jgi:hypothetical protein